MSTLTFDTHSFVKRLVAAGMPEEQAEALAQEQTRVIDEKLATKQAFENTDDAIVALIDCIKSLCEVFVAKKIASPSELSVLFRHQMNGYLQKKQPDAASVMALILQYLERSKANRALLERDPEGEA